MKKDALTAKEIEHAKPDPEKRIEMPAGPPKGLYLVIQPSGAKSWAFRYRWHGRPRKLTLGPYPETKLAKARASAEAALDDLDNDKDPSLLQQQEAEVEALKQESVGAVVDEFLKRALEDKERDRGETERILRRETKVWKTRDIVDITKPDVLRRLDEIVDRGASVMACRTRTVFMRFFKWAKGRGYVESSPMLEVPKPGPDHEDRDRVLEPSELLEVWNAVEGFGYPFGPFIRFLILTAQRRGEVATMRWRDVDKDAALWTLPREATKAGRVHDVPLSPAALEILDSLPRFTKGDYVWTCTSGEIPVNNWSKTKGRIDTETLKRRTVAGIEKNIADWTLHDLRRTAATHMAKAGVPPHVLAAILNHTPGSTQGVTSIYNRFRYTEERRQALETWAQYLMKPAEKKQVAS